MSRGVSRVRARIVIVMALMCGLVMNPAIAPASRGPIRDANSADDTGKPSGVAAVVSAYVPDLAPLVSQTASELREVVERYSLDRAGLMRRYSVEYSPVRRETMREFYKAWQTRLESLNFDALGQDGKIDYLLMKNRIGYELQLLKQEDEKVAEAAPLLPFAGTIVNFQEARRRMEPLDSAAAAGALAKLTEQIEKTRKAVEAGLKPEPKPAEKTEAETKPESKAPAKAETKSQAKPETKVEAKAPAKLASKPETKLAEKIEPIKTTQIVGLRASQILASLRGTLEQWYKYYADYDPLFTWWASAPYKKTDDALKAYLKVLRERVVGVKEGEDEPIVGDPIGKQALISELGFELIAYSPEDLVAVAEREFAWCEAEMKKASREMGLGDDWKAALEKVKNLHVDPGKQPDLIRDQAREAIEYVEKRDLVTVPPLLSSISQSTVPFSLITLTLLPIAQFPATRF